MNNEPVAYMTPTKALYLVEDVDGCIDPRHTPLYTHPQLRELTDEEMQEIAERTLGHAIGLYNWKIFAKELFKKAQEK